VEQTRFDLAHELLDDVERLDVQLKESHRRIKTAVKAFGNLAHRALRRRSHPGLRADWLHR
jgi:hypothetical protein